MLLLHLSYVCPPESPRWLTEVQLATEGKGVAERKKTQLKPSLLWKQSPCMFPGHKHCHLCLSKLHGFGTILVDLSGIRAACLPLLVLYASSELPASVHSLAPHCGPCAHFQLICGTVPIPTSTWALLSSGLLRPLLLCLWKETNDTYFAGLQSMIETILAWRLTQRRPQIMVAVNMICSTVSSTGLQVPRG